MASEKAMYWMAVAVLAFGVANGMLNDRPELVTRLADRSIAMMEQAADTAVHYTTLADVNLGNDGPGRAQMAVVRAQDRLAHVQRIFMRRQAEIERAQAKRIRAIVEHGPRTVFVCARQNFAIDIPQPPAHNMF